MIFFFSNSQSEFFFPDYVVLRLIMQFTVLFYNVVLEFVVITKYFFAKFAKLIFFSRCSFIMTIISKQPSS